MRALGMLRRMIFAVRTLNAAMAGGVFFGVPMSGSFHIAQSRTRVAKCFERASTQASHPASPSSLVGKPPARSQPPPPS